MGTIVSAMLSAASPVCAAADLNLPLLWTADSKTFLESAPIVADIDGDGADEAIVAGREELIVYNGDGKEEWRWRTRGRLMTYPAVLARERQSSLIYVAVNQGWLSCLDGTGKEVWHAELKGPSEWSAAVVCNLKSQAAPAVVQTDTTGRVWTFNALSGDVVWQATLKGTPVSPSVGDLDGDGAMEIVVATGAGVLAALNETGTVIWERKIGDTSPSWATSAPVIFAASTGQARIAAASSEGNFLVLDGLGRTLWERPLRGAAASSISVGDLDLDGRADIFAITQLGVIYRFDEDGRVLWDIDMQGRTLAPGAIADLDGDGRLEFICSTQSGHLQVLNDRGELIFEHYFKNRTINVTPALAKLKSDDKTLQMVLTGGESGIVFCFGTPMPANATIQWRQYRYDATNRGAWLNLRQAGAALMTAINLTPEEIYTGDMVRFGIKGLNVEKDPHRATAVCIRPDGSRQTSTTVVSGAEGELQLPLELAGSGNYEISWSLENPKGRLLASGSRKLFLQPFVNDRSLARKALDALNSSARVVEPVLPLSANALRREAEALKRELVDLEQHGASVEAGTPAEVRDKIVSLVARSRRALRLSELMPMAAPSGPGTSLVAFEGTRWESRGVEDQMPSFLEAPLKLSPRVVPGEHDPISLGLLNITDREIHVRVTMEMEHDDLRVNLHRSIGVPTSHGGRAWDPLPELDESGVLAVPALSTRELWLDTYIGAVPPGEHRVKVRLQALDGAGVLDGPKNPRDVAPPETNVEVAYRVLPFEIAPASSMRMCTWAAPEGAQVEDLLAHGNNVFCAPLSQAQYDAQRRLTGYDYAKLDAVVERMRGADVVLLLTGIPTFQTELGTPQYQEELRPYLENLVAHLGVKGLDTRHFALYPLDEPGGYGWNAVNKVVEFGKLVRSINPDVMMYVNGGGELPMFEAMAPYTDVWCPALHMLPEDTPVMDFLRDSKRIIWSYNCGYPYSRPIGANIKDANVVAEFRIAGLFAFRYGATGIGYWCYNTGGDTWTRVQNEYMLVYPGRERPVTSRRWEAVREGIEDYRILTALRARLSAPENPLSEEIRAKIAHLMDVSLPAMIDRSFWDMSRGVARYVIDLENNDATVAAFRNELMDCVQAIARAGKDDGD
ncbi:MAG: PQQ-binding-like beta-propeller repeat protein [Candidatus Hydrogenedentes bacterium]|nr:PQQ-binding-like beta-propeller repeat protein [Candidatus Hydrogenedentota bacterium]